MSHKTFDQIFRRKLYQHEMPVAEGLWANIQAEIQPPKRDRKVFGWIIFGSLGLVLLLTALFVYNSDPSSLAQKSQTTEITANILPGTAPLAVQQIDTKNDESKGQETITSIPTDTEKRHRDIITRDAKTKEKNVINFSSEQNKGLKDAGFYKTSDIHITETPVSSNQPLIETGLITEKNGIAPAPPSRSKIQIDPVSSILNQFAQEKPEIPIPENVNTDCYAFSKGRGISNIIVEAYGGPGFNLKSMTSNGTEVTNYIMAREETENFQYAFHGGFRVSFAMENGLALRTGAHYSQIGELFDYTDPASTRFVTTITLDTIRDGNGNIVSINSDTTTQLVTGTLIKKIHNRFHSIDIPFLVGYEMSLGRLEVSASAGPVLNISSWTRGQILGSSLDPIEFSDPLREPTNEIYDPVFKRKLGLGMYVGVGLHYPLAESLYLSFEPHVLHRFQPVTIESYDIEQRSTQVGLSIGLRKKFY